MLQAYPLEGQAGPSAMNARIEGMAPESRITAGLLDELVIEERVVVDKLSAWEKVRDEIVSKLFIME